MAYVTETPKKDRLHQNFIVGMQCCKRCQNPNNIGFDKYGGRGIKVCERWLTYENFLADMGRRPNPSEKYSLDRYPDNDGNYEPGNCRWATRSDQQKNKRRYKHRRPKFVA